MTGTSGVLTQTTRSKLNSWSAQPKRVSSSKIRARIDRMPKRLLLANTSSGDEIDGKAPQPMSALVVFAGYSR